MSHRHSIRLSILGGVILFGAIAPVTTFAGSRHHRGSISNHSANGSLHSHAAMLSADRSGTLGPATTNRNDIAGRLGTGALTLNSESYRSGVSRSSISIGSDPMFAATGTQVGTTDTAQPMQSSTSNSSTAPTTDSFSPSNFGSVAGGPGPVTMMPEPSTWMTGALTLVLIGYLSRRANAFGTALNASPGSDRRRTCRVVVRPLPDEGGSLSLVRRRRRTHAARGRVTDP